MPEMQPENDRPENDRPETADTDMPETADTDMPESADQTDREDSGETAQAPKTQPSTEESGSPEAPPSGVSTTYEHTASGHRITRRTVHRSEITEDTHETIEETFPVPTVGVPVPYAPPMPDHPSPVG